jgi:TRAP-type C4-dicarboxylate transport system substrate-binding protein
MSCLLRWGSVTGMNPAMSMPLAATTLAVALVGLTACTGMPSIGKSGAVKQAVTVITLQMPDTGDPDGLYFARDVARRSHGTLEVDVDGNSYASTLPSNEGRLAAALRAGRVGFSYQSARDWAAAGVAGFQALDTPFLVTTLAASEALAASPVAAALLGQLSPLGLVGIGLIPAEPRQFLSARPLIAPSAFDGISLRIIDNPQTAALVGALGAHPVQGKSASQVGDLLRSGSIAGAETSPQQVLENSYNAEAPYLTSYAIIPKFETIVASRRAWLALTAAQQAAIRQAAADTVVNARQVPAREQQELFDMCGTGLVLDEPSPAQLAVLAGRAASTAPAGAAAAAMTRMIRADVLGTGPQPSAVPPPSQCRIASTAAQAIALHNLSVPGGSAPQGATIPPGTYVTTDTVADFVNGGQYGPDWQTTITFILYLYPDGTVLESQRPNYPDQGVGRGRYVVKGDEVTFIWDSGTGLTPQTLRWSYYDGQLTFAIESVQDIGSRIIFTAHPWRKVG